jgi:hypothetical protein
MNGVPFVGREAAFGTLRTVLADAARGRRRARRVYQPAAFP